MKLTTTKYILLCAIKILRHHITNETRWIYLRPNNQLSCGSVFLTERYQITNRTDQRRILFYFFHLKPSRGFYFHSSGRIHTPVSAQHRHFIADQGRLQAVLSAFAPLRGGKFIDDLHRNRARV